MQKKTVRWGIIGLGRIAHKFVKDLLLLPNVELYAVASRTPEKAALFAAQYQSKLYFDDYETMLKACSTELDVVYIATPHVGHYEATMLCLKYKVGVLCEKPFAMHQQQVQQMITLAAQQNTYLMEALWTRFLPTTLRIVELIQSGVIGKIKSIQADFGFYSTFDENSRIFNKKLGGGALLDVGIYPVFLSYLLLGKPKDIMAKAVFGKTEIDETTMAILSYENEQLAFIHTNIIGKTPTEALIYGEKGMIHWHGRFHEPTKGFTLKVYDEYEQFFPFEWTSGGYDYEAKAVCEDIVNEKVQNELWTWQNSLDLIGILDAIRQKIGLSYS